MVDEGSREATGWATIHREVVPTGRSAWAGLQPVRPLDSEASGHRGWQSDSSSALPRFSQAGRVE